MKKILGFLLGCWGVFCILGGFAYIIKAPIRGVFLLLEGIVCLPVYTKIIKKTNLDNKKTNIIRVVAIIIFLFVGFLNVPISNTPVATESMGEKKVEEPKEEIKKEKETKKDTNVGKKLDRFAEWRVKEVNNNSSSNVWKFCEINEDLNIKDADLLKDYYNKFFEDENEIHFLLTDKKTTKLSTNGMYPYLFATVHERLKGEEGNADNLGAGKVIDEFMINLETGEIE